MRKILSLILLSTSIPSLSYAARPLSTDDAGTVEKTHFELESGFEYVKQNDEERILNFVLKYGIIEDLDLGLELLYKFIDFKESRDVDGAGDIKITTKYRFLDVEDLPLLSLSFGIKTETADEGKGLGSGEEDYILNSIMTREIDKFTAHLNLGYTFVGEPEKDRFSYGLAAGYTISEDLNIVCEINGETIFDGDFDDNPCSGLVGLDYALNEITTLDFGIGFEISDASPDYRIVIGSTSVF